MSIENYEQELYSYSLETPVCLNFPHGFLYALCASGTSYFLEGKLSLNSDIFKVTKTFQNKYSPH